ncbi:MAG: hypothetical protein Q9195_006646 [Heterodermia aff. obscurata]
MPYAQSVACLSLYLELHEVSVEKSAPVLPSAQKPSRGLQPFLTSSSSVIHEMPNREVKVLPFEQYCRFNDNVDNDNALVKMCPIQDFEPAKTSKKSTPRITAPDTIKGAFNITAARNTLKLDKRAKCNFCEEQGAKRCLFDDFYLDDNGKDDDDDKYSDDNDKNDVDIESLDIE